MEDTTENYGVTKWLKKKYSELKSWFFEEIKLTDLQLGSLRKRTQINKIRNERGEITTDTKEIQRIVRENE